MIFAWPWLFVLLPLPWLLRALLPEYRPALTLRVPRLPDCASVRAASVRTPLKSALAWVMLILAVARPQMDGPMPLPDHGRSMMLALDVSASMGVTDLTLHGAAVTRLHAAQQLADGFLGLREGDRVGLIVFGSQAYLHTPPSFDLRAVRDAVWSAQLGLAGRETALGDAIALAVKYLQELPDSARVLLLLTDGANTAGVLDPTRAAWLAARAGVRLHILGIGGAEALEEPELQRLALQSGGTYQRATDATAMRAFFATVDALEKRVARNEQSRPRRELYAWPLALCLILAWSSAAKRVRGARP